MNILYFDCFSGISGDMILGGLASLGADFSLVQDQLNAILPDTVYLSFSSNIVMGISAYDVTITCESPQKYRHLSDMLAIVNGSSLDPEEKQLAARIFGRLAAAEAHIHGIPIDEVHFHEIGAIDTLVDVLGSILALRQLAADEIYSSTIPLNTGLVPMAHGLYPLPAPATLELLKGVPCYGVESEVELVTPTGAAILTSICSHFGPIPAMEVQNVGYGAGKSRRKNVPNVLRIIRGVSALPVRTADTVGVLETVIDDISPEYLAHFFDRFFLQEGAIDLFIQTVQMKKSRTGFQVQCLVRPDRIPAFVDLLMDETGTLGVRHRLESRTVVPRETREIMTRWGMAVVKVWQGSDGSRRFSPEYEVCKVLAREAKVPLRAVVEEVWLTAAREIQGI